MDDQLTDSTPSTDWEVSGGHDHDAEDVAALLARETQDGPGLGDPGPEDFESFADSSAEDGVE